MNLPSICQLHLSNILRNISRVTLSCPLCWNCYKFFQTANNLSLKPFSSRRLFGPIKSNPGLWGLSRVFKGWKQQPRWHRCSLPRRERTFRFYSKGFRGWAIQLYDHLVRTSRICDIAVPTTYFSIKCLKERPFQSLRDQYHRNAWILEGPDYSNTSKIIEVQRIRLLSAKYFMYDIVSVSRSKKFTSSTMLVQFWMSIFVIFMIGNFLQVLSSRSFSSIIFQFVKRHTFIEKCNRVG